MTHMAPHTPTPSGHPGRVWQCWRNPQHQDTVITDFGWPCCADCGAAPAYHERVSYLPADLELPVFVPRSDRALIAPRSAVVGHLDPDGTGRFVVHYEGWVHGPAQYGERDARGLWEAGVEHAAGRKVTAYPTMAVATFPANELHQVGTYRVSDKRVDVTDEAALAQWLAG